MSTFFHPVSDQNSPLSNGGSPKGLEPTLLRNTRRHATPITLRPYQ